MVSRRVLYFIIKVSIKGIWVRLILRGGKIEEIKCRIVVGVNFMEVLVLILLVLGGGGGSGFRELESKDIGLVFSKFGFFFV